MKKSTSRKKRNLLQNILYGIYLLASWIVKKVKNLKFSKVLVVMIIVSTTLFVLKMIQIYEVQGQVPDELIRVLIPSLLGELWILSKIKQRKDEIKYLENTEDNDDDYLGG